MRKLWVCGLLLCSAFGFIAGIAQAQTETCPISLKVTRTSIDATNVSSKAVVLIGVQVTDTNASSVSGDDLYFKPLAAGDTYNLASASPDPNEAVPSIVSAKVVVVQFADGTTCGDSSLLQTEFADMMEGRVVAREFYKDAISAYDMGGDWELVSFLTKAKKSRPPNTDPAYGPLPNLHSLGSSYLRIQQTSGSRAAISQIQSRLDAAQGRSF